MNENIIPNDAEQFLLRTVDSVAQWEGLLLLRSEPARQWTVSAVARHLYISEQETASLLEALVERKILVFESDQFRYAPETPDGDALIGRCAELYRKYLIPITRIIHSKPRRVQAFADAFRLRKDK